MKPIYQTDIWQLLAPYLGDIEPAATQVTLNFGGISNINVLAAEPKLVQLAKTQTDRLWRKLAHVANLPVQGVKKAVFELKGNGSETPLFHIEMKPQPKPTMKTRRLRLSKRNGENIEVLGEQVILHDVGDIGLIVVSMEADERLHKHLQEFSDALASRGDKVVVVALPHDADLETYAFEEVVES